MIVLFPWMSLWWPKAEKAERERINQCISNGDFDFSDVPCGAETEFLRQAELCLQSTIQVAIASDSRATTLTGTLGAASAALLVLSGNIVSKEGFRLDLLAATIVGSFCLMIAASLCAAAARPIHFHTAGYQPAVLYAAAGSERHIKLVAASDIQIRIEANNWALEKASQALSLGRILAAFAPFISFIVFCFLYHP